MLIELKSQVSGAVLFSGEFKDIKTAVEQAILEVCKP